MSVLLSNCITAGSVLLNQVVSYFLSVHAEPYRRLPLAANHPSWPFKLTSYHSTAEQAVERLVLAET